MNPQKAAAAINTIALGLGELAEALNETSSTGTLDQGRGMADASPGGSPAPTSFEASPFPDEFLEAQPNLSDASVEFAQGSEAMCPAHRKPFVEGKYGPYCTSPTDDEAWSNRKGYCTITPKNVAQYLRVKAAA